ncbi:MAG: D-alanyl-D-alanine carboxypeptidase/D-alanyl-D-alanine-endopeptidase [Micrococcales bacterium]|nr:D-alanyl-D-alanine carboxypeptidase/D-alanyl-D-alanine-endopeptidase [Micrococcales bacterium]
MVVIVLSAAGVGLALPSAACPMSAPAQSANATLEPQPVANQLSPEASAPAAASVDLAAAELSESNLGPGFAVQVSDVLTGQALFQVNGEEARKPASTLKIFTAAAALTTLGGEHTFGTTVVMTQTGAQSATLTLVAGGDVLIGQGAGQIAQVNGRAGMAELASQVSTNVRARGINQVQVVLDDTIFTGPDLLPDWDWWPGASWGGPIGPLAINAGHEGPGFDQEGFSADAALAAAEFFRQELAVAGQDQGLALPFLEVTGPVARQTVIGAGVEVGRVDSAPVRELTAYMLEHSDNVVAEVLGRMTAKAQGLEASFAGAGQAIEQAAEELGVDTANLHLADASGLSRGSGIPPSALTQLLVTAATAADATDLRALTRGLAVGGLQGTLENRFVEGGTAGLVWAKTGTLTGVTSLAGYLQTASGRELAFAVMADQTGEVGYFTARDAIDQFVTALVLLS